MADAMYKSNQRIITFQRTTGMSLSMLNKYASASAMVNTNASLEGTAGSLSNVANRLWDIRMGRGDVSPYQELALVGGKQINPFNKSVSQVIEEVREAIKGVDDLQATNIITRMGFNPEDLLMLRMTRAEFEEVNSLFLDPKSQEAMNQYGIRMKKVHLEFNLFAQTLALKFMKYFVPFMESLSRQVEIWTQISRKISDATNGVVSFDNALKVLGATLGVVLIRLNPLVAGLTALYLILEDIAVYALGGDSVLGAILSQDFMPKDPITPTFQNWLKYIGLLTGKMEALAGASAIVYSTFKMLQDIWNRHTANPQLGYVPAGMGLGSTETNYININSSLPPSSVISDVKNHYGFSEAQNTAIG